MWFRILTSTIHAHTGNYFCKIRFFSVAVNLAQIHLFYFIMFCFFIDYHCFACSLLLSISFSLYAPNRFVSCNQLLWWWWWYIYYHHFLLLFLHYSMKNIVCVCGFVVTNFYTTQHTRTHTRLFVRNKNRVLANSILIFNISVLL